MKPGKVFAIIMGERMYQDAQLEKSRFQIEIQTVAAELLLMKSYLDKAMEAWTYNYGDAPALHEIRKVAALAVRCMENHGALPRELAGTEVLEVAEVVKEKEEEDEVPF